MYNSEKKKTPSTERLTRGRVITEQLGQGGGVPDLVALRARFAPTTTGVPEIRVDLPPIGSYDALLSSPQANAGATA